MRGQTHLESNLGLNRKQGWGRRRLSETDLGQKGLLGFCCGCRVVFLPKTVAELLLSEVRDWERALCSISLCSFLCVRGANFAVVHQPNHKVVDKRLFG